MLAVPGDQVNLVQENFCRRLEETVGLNMRLTCIMVGLRNKERFFSHEREDRRVNPGTIVKSQMNSFFLVSQQSTSSSITPTYYKVIHTNNNSEFEEGHLQELTFTLCHNYAN